MPSSRYIAGRSSTLPSHHQRGVLAETVIPIEIVLRERVFLPPMSADGHDPDQEEDDMPPGSGERPVAVDRDHPQWAEVNAEQQERTQDPGSG